MTINPEEHGPQPFEAPVPHDPPPPPGYVDPLAEVEALDDLNVLIERTTRDDAETA